MIFTNKKEKDSFHNLRASFAPLRHSAVENHFVFLNTFFLMPEISRKKLAFFLISSTLFITFVFYGYQILYTPNILVDRDDKLFIVRSGYTFRNVQRTWLMEGMSTTSCHLVFSRG